MFTDQIRLKNYEDLPGADIKILETIVSLRSERDLGIPVIQPIYFIKLKQSFRVRFAYSPYFIGESSRRGRPLGQYKIL